LARLQGFTTPFSSPTGVRHQQGNQMVAKPAKKKYRFHHYKHANYQLILDAVRKEYLSEGEHKHLAVPYVLMCATTLEARLNDELHGYASKIWGDDYKSIADAYLSMSFRGKLTAVVPFLTNNKYRINQKHIVYQRLASLITVRNLLVHPEPTVEKFEIRELPEDKRLPFPYPQLPREIFEKLDDLTMGATKKYTPVEYHDAIKKFERWFFNRYPDRLSKVSMVVKGKMPSR
jgi:hypothetical protein